MLSNRWVRATITVLLGLLLIGAFMDVKADERRLQRRLSTPGVQPADWGR